MPLYTVDIEYLARHGAHVVVEAENEDEARQKILEDQELVAAEHRHQLCRNHDFSGEILEGSVEIFSIEEDEELCP